MKYITLIIFIFLASCQNKKVNFLITGKVSGIDGALVSLKNYGNRDTLLQAVVANNAFVFNGIVPNEGFYEIHFEGSYPMGKLNIPQGWVHSCLIYIQKGGKYTFLARSDLEILHNKYKILTNVRQHNLYERFHEEYRSARAKKIARQDSLEILMAAADKKQDYLTSKRLTEKHLLLSEEILKLRQVMTHSFVSREHEAIYTPFLIMKASDMNSYSKFYDSALNNLSKELKNHPYALLARKAITKANKVMNEQSVFPNIAAKDFSGNPFNLENYKQKTTLIISFWATWCTPCIEEIHFLKKHPQILPSNSEIIFLSIDQNPSYWGRMTKELKLTNSFLLSKNDRRMLIERFNIISIPRNLIISNSGKVLFQKAPSVNEPGFSEHFKQHITLENRLIVR